MRSKAVSTIVLAMAVAVSLHVFAAQAPALAVGQAVQGAPVGAQGRGAAPAPPGQPTGVPPGARRGGPNPDPWPGQKKLLMVADIQTGYHHDAINHTMGIVEELGRKNHAFVTVIRTDSQLFTKQPLKGQGRYANGNANMNVRLDAFDVFNSFGRRPRC